ncbi:SVM family protein ['Fragaria x ananassa' phyllody phytoplasma]|uniref:SVM family protein n=1 Tax='Fragaria x ananassa' phyllody phytoplasma TaxID=2358428 RepID=A0ABS5K3C7_9MOLU|nr:SVM family protein ['Fragaria x ananassa' phyllody phytoplasma]MBS2126378.1 SVM family protein ['Fragaria x ananassa' phyllody phytoplasma]
MVQLKKQLKTIYLCLIAFIGLLFIVNNQIYASPGINLDIRKTQFEEEQNNLMQQLINTFNNMTLNSETRLNRMRQISARIDIVQNNIRIINQQIIRRYQYNQQRQNNQN